MARINIEDSLLKDSRFIDLCIHFSDKQKALGAVAWAFILAQKFYLKSDDHLIPLKEWSLAGCDNALIKYGLAEERENGIYVSGSEKQFSWLTQKVEAGKSSARLKQQKKSTGVDSRSTESNGAQPPSSFLLPLSLSQKQEYIYTSDLVNNIRACWKMWSNSLRRQKIPIGEMSPSHEIVLARAISLHGFEQTIDAIEGYGLETSTNDFKPQNYASLEYVLVKNLKTGKSNVERLANMARAERNKLTIEHDTSHLPD